MAGITQKSCVTLFPSWSLKENRGGVYRFKTTGNMKSSKIVVNVVRDTDILIMLLLLMIAIMLIILLVAAANHLMKVIIVIIIIKTM